MAPLPRLFKLANTLSYISATVTPRDKNRMLIRRTTTNPNPGAGSVAPDAIKNKAFFALFAILGAAMVVGSIWFFFWAKDGGFVWYENDWEDYKSTVLRRKDKDGKTLSNATKSTKLGQKSVAGTLTDYDRDEKIEIRDYGRKTGKRSEAAVKTWKPSDYDVRDYRHEKPARVGGMNRQADGNYLDYTNNEPSDVASDMFGSDISSRPLTKKPAELKRTKHAGKRRERKQDKTRRDKEQKTIKRVDMQERKSTSTTTTHFKNGADGSMYAKDAKIRNNSYYSAYRPREPAPARHESPRRSKPTSANHSRQSSPRKHLPKPPGSFDAYSDVGSDAGRGYIPPISRPIKDTGYRRDAFGGRRDSLSDNDGDLGSRRW